MKTKTRVYAIWAAVLALIFAQIACAAPTNIVKTTQTLPPVVAAPTEEVNQPTQEDTITPTQETTVPTITEVQPTETSNSGNACNTKVSGTSQASGLITTVTLAKGTEGDQKNPVNPTTVFQPNDVIHAVVTLKDAPQDTALKAVWYATDVGSVAPCNTQITATDLTTDGSRNVDFSLTPEKSWPVGSYRSEIFVNNALDQVAVFTVK